MLKQLSLRAVLLVLFLAALVTQLPAQVGTSNISGIVTDPTGAVIPGTKVTITNQATGITYTAATNSTGAYAVTSVPVGMYTIRVEQPGFKTFVSKDNVLEVGRPIEIDVKMTIGEQNQTVDVESAYEKLEASNAKIGNVVEQKAIETLPLNGRNPLTLITLEPGVVQRSAGAAGSGIHVNGSRDRAFNVTIDGIDANESSVPNPVSNLYRLNPDNVQEYRVITSNATPEEGRNSGANIAVVTRSGTNEFHGTAFEFFRNTALNANDWFANAQGTPKPEIKLHQFGAEGGGPIIKNKTFFFFSWQDSQISSSQPIDQTFGVPILYTPSALAGNFRYWIADPKVPFVLNGQTITRNSPLLVNPTNGALNPGVPVCGGAVATNCVATYNIFANDPKGIGADPKILGLFKTYPQPNTFAFGDGLNTAGFFWNPPVRFKGPNFLVRVDHSFNANNNIFVRWLQANANTLGGDPLNGRPQVFPGFPPLGEVLRTTKGLAISYRRVISPTVVNEFTTGFSRFIFTFTQGEANPAFPNVVPYSFSNVSLPFINTPRTARVVTTPQFVDNLSIIKGSHIIRVGTNIRLYEHNDQRGQPGGINVTPSLSFSGITRPPVGFNTPAVGSSTKPGINSSDNSNLLNAINELSGIPARLSQAFLGDLTSNSFLPFQTGNSVTLFNEGHRLKQYNFYFQDEWKVRPNLTLNYGLRWEINLAPTEAGGRVFVPDKPINGSQGAVTFVHADRWFDRNNLDALAPRLALAWNPRGDTKTVIRSGYGVYFDPLNSFQATAVSGKVPGLVTSCSSTVGGSTTPGCPAVSDLRIGQGFPFSLQPPTTQPTTFLTLPAQLYSNAPTVTVFDPEFKLATVHQWNISVQRELPWGFVAQGAYIGHRGLRLQREYDLNQIDAGPILPSFLIMQRNLTAGCKPDGSGCPPGVTGTPVPIVASGALKSSFVNSSSVVGDLNTNAAGLFAQRIEQTTLALHLRPNQQFNRITYIDSGGDSYYHAFQGTLRKRFEKGWLFGLAYTYGKSIDDMSVDPVGAASGGGLSTTGARGVTDVRNFRLDRSRSDFDRKHTLVINSVYDLPLGRGKLWGNNWNGALNQLLGGWSINGIFTRMSGEPFSVTSGTFTENNGHISRAALVGQQPELSFTNLSGIPGPVYFPNAKAFRIPDPGTTGIGRNTFEAPAFTNIDIGIGKKFPVNERININFRMEMFNALNHANFDNPRDASVGSPNIRSSVFAQSCCAAVAPPTTQTIIQTGESARVIQFALKVVF